MNEEIEKENKKISKVPKPRYVVEYRKKADWFKFKPHYEGGNIDKMILRSFISLLIVSLIILANTMDNFVSIKIVQGVKWCLNWQIEEESIEAFFTTLGVGSKILEIELEGFSEPIKNGIVVSSFGPRIHPIYKTSKMHEGVDIDAKHGEDIYAATSGVVQMVGEDATSGKYVRIINGDYTTIYAHCSKILVEEGQTIYQNDIIAKVGDTGLTTGPHLHFGIMEKDIMIDPLEKLLNYANKV